VGVPSGKECQVSHQIAMTSSIRIRRALPNSRVWWSAFKLYEFGRLDLAEMAGRRQLSSHILTCATTSLLPVTVPECSRIRCLA
jgi:hypothetical protein